MKQQILAIDDSKAIRFLLQTVLSKRYDVITIPDGCSAMYWLSKRRLPDLFIIDPQLPDMENWELIQHLSSSGIFGDIPIIALSSLSLIETQTKCEEYKVASHFLKPFNPVHLLSEINKVLSVTTINDYSLKAS
ncbi:MAG TPA: response regulator [Puia sp.]|jgi:CheY-like chemotaxis protein|nr:response regulator [Puia sp.]